MGNKVSDVIFIRGEAIELRYEALDELRQAPTAKFPPAPAKYKTLVYEHHTKPESYIKPLVILRGKHYYDIKFQGTLRGWQSGKRYMIQTMLLSDRDYASEWIKAGITDTRGRVWFVNPA